MAEGTEYNMTLTFPDAKAREDFEIAFHGWLKEYQQRVTIHRALGAAMAGDAAEGDDTAGHLFGISITTKKGGTIDVYINAI
jgi:hypothetical protein